MSRPSWYHVATRSVFLAVALLLGLVLYYLPNFLELDEFRPQVQQLLENSFHCHALVGNVSGEVFPYPGLVVGHVVLLRDSTPPRLLASVTAIHLWLSPWSLTGRLQFRAIRFYKPRFIVHRESMGKGEDQWVLLGLPGLPAGPAASSGIASGIPAATGSASTKEVVNDWQVRNGSIELCDHRTIPATRWVADQFTGAFMMSKGTGAITGKMSRLGRHALLDIHYDNAATYPLHVHLTDIELKSVQSILETDIPALDGTTDFAIKARFEPTLAIQASMAPVLLPRLQGNRLSANGSLENNHWQAELRSGTTAPMTVSLRGAWGPAEWHVQIKSDGYDTGLVRGLYQQTWVDRLEGPGKLTAEIHSRAGSWGWSAEGQNFDFEGSAMHLPEWSANGDAKHLSVYVHGITSGGGMTDVTWSKPADQPDAALQVDVSSVTIRQVLEIFHLQSKPAQTGAMNPHGYETWLVDKGSMQGQIHGDASLQFQESELDIGAMHVNWEGTFGLSSANPQAHIQGDIQNIPIATMIESFFKPPSPLTGEAKLNFNLDFLMTPQWINGLNGPLDNVEVDHGVLRTLKTMYRIISVLNLGNYLRLRFPQITAQGIVFESLKGGLKFQNGVLSSDDLFLKSPNMNVGAKGSLDIPGKRLHLTLRLELFRFLEDILRDVPITHWIFKKPSKILLPVVVVLEGPWDNVDVR